MTYTYTIPGHQRRAQLKLAKHQSGIHIDATIPGHQRRAQLKPRGLGDLVLLVDTIPGHQRRAQLKPTLVQVPRTGSRPFPAISAGPN